MASGTQAVFETAFTKVFPALFAGTEATVTAAGGATDARDQAAGTRCLPATAARACTRAAESTAAPFAFTPLVVRHTVVTVGARHREPILQ